MSFNVADHNAGGTLEESMRRTIVVAISTHAPGRPVPPLKGLFSQNFVQNTVLSSAIAVQVSITAPHIVFTGEWRTMDTEDHHHWRILGQCCVSFGIRWGRAGKGETSRTRKVLLKLDIVDPTVVGTRV